MARLIALPVYVWGLNKGAVVYLPLVALMFAAPWIWRDRINPDRPVIVPMLAVTFVWFLAPGTALKTALLYHRFAVFLLPAYVLMLSAPRTSSAGARRALSSTRSGRLRGVGVQVVIISGCWIFLSDQAIRLHRFAVENAPLDKLLAQTEPGQRALNLVFDRTSPAYGGPVAYAHQSYFLLSAAGLAWDVTQRL